MLLLKPVLVQRTLVTRTSGVASRIFSGTEVRYGIPHGWGLCGHRFWSQICYHISMRYNACFDSFLRNGYDFPQCRSTKRQCQQDGQLDGMVDRASVHQAHVAVPAMPCCPETQTCLSTKPKCLFLSVHGTRSLLLFLTSGTLRCISMGNDRPEWSKSKGQSQNPNDSIAADPCLQNMSCSSESHLSEQQPTQLTENVDCCKPMGLNAFLHLESGVLIYTNGGINGENPAQETMSFAPKVKMPPYGWNEDHNSKTCPNHSSGHSAYGIPRLNRYKDEVMRELEREQRREVNKIPFTVRRTGKARFICTRPLITILRDSYFIFWILLVVHECSVRKPAGFPQVVEFPQHSVHSAAES